MKGGWRGIGGGGKGEGWRVQRDVSNIKAIQIFT
jgi:hypothetical protein